MSLESLKLDGLKLGEQSVVANYLSTLLISCKCLFTSSKQASTFKGCVACIDENCNSNGISNVVTSRTPNPKQFAITKPETISTLQPSPEISGMVENEYNKLSGKDVHDINDSFKKRESKKRENNYQITSVLITK